MKASTRLTHAGVLLFGVTLLLATALTGTARAANSLTDFFVVSRNNGAGMSDPRLSRMDKDGNVLWTEPLPSAPGTAFQVIGTHQGAGDRNVSEDSLYLSVSYSGVNQIDGRDWLYVYDANGDIKWKRDFPATSWMRVAADPVNGGAFLGIPRYGVAKVDGNGNVLWGPKDFGRSGDFSVAADVVTGGVYVTVWDNSRVLKVDRNGNLVWDVPLPAPSSPMACPLDGGLYVGSGSYAHGTYKLDADGTVQWLVDPFPNPNYPYTYWRAVSPVDGGLYVFGQLGKLNMDGTTAWFRLDLDGIGHPSVAADLAENYLYASRWPGQSIYKIDGPTGDIVWSRGLELYLGAWDVWHVLWTGTPALNSAPIADAGTDQGIHLGLTALLDGSGSSDPDGDSLDYQWAVLGRPIGSIADVSDPAIVNPTLAPDRAGDYVLQLTVTDKHGATASDTMIVSTRNTAPVAAAGADDVLERIGQPVVLDGTQSYDLEGDPITYVWSFLSRPSGSVAALDDADSAKPSFTPDKYGDYELQLVVSDPWAASAPDTVRLSFRNLPPVADAGSSQSLVVGESALLDGSASTDPNGDTLTYSWSVLSGPSECPIADPSAPRTSLTPDAAGTYIVQLVVNDGLLDSSPPATIELQVVSRQSAAFTATQLAQEQAAALQPAAFKNVNMQNALANKFNAAIAAIESGDYQCALGQLQNDILGKTDGCAATGAPDKNDWIRDSQAQADLYPQVGGAIVRVRALL